MSKHWLIIHYLVLILLSFSASVSYSKANIANFYVAKLCVSIAEGNPSLWIYHLLNCKTNVIDYRRYLLNLD